MLPLEIAPMEVMSIPYVTTFLQNRCVKFFVVVEAMIQAVSDDMSVAEVERAAAAVGWTTEPRPCRIVLSRCFGIDSIQACLVPPRIGGCEVGEAGWTVPGPRFLRHVGAGGLGLSVGTGTAYQYELALTFSRALCRRFPEIDARASEIDRAIHELVANALVHGNLGVRSPAAGMEGFDAYCKALDAALAVPANLERRIEISALKVGDWIEIVITDQGAGFDPVTSADLPVSPRQHGLSIASAVGVLSFEDGGCCAVLRIEAVLP